PEGLQGRRAVAAGLLQLRRADRADEVGGLDAGPADRALRAGPQEMALERPQLRPPGLHVREGLRRPEEQVRERPGKRPEPEQRRRRAEPGIADPAPCVAVNPKREP